MLVAVIKGPTLSLAKKQMEKALPYADIFEWRLDYFTTIDLEKIKKLQLSVSLPIIFTLRKQAQGGKYVEDEKIRLQKLQELACLHPAFIDFEYDTDVAIAGRIKEISPSTQIIISYHNFEQTPEDLFSLLDTMQKPFAAIYKIACKANSTNDLLRLLNFCKKEAGTKQLCCISMGEYGAPSRVLGPIVGNYFDYASIEKEESQLYQLTLQELHDIYNYPFLNYKTKIYALLGDPVDKSVGHLFHNRIFKEKKQNAVYVKLKLQKNELSTFFSLIQDLPFKGFSITMPLKEEVQPFLDHIDHDAKKIGAINTIAITDHKKSGCNTDAPGALDAIEAYHSVRGKTVLLLGAGGSAKAIAFEAMKRGAKVIIVNRNEEKAKKIADDLSCVGYGFDALGRIYENGYDILINATPVGMLEDELPLPKKYILSSSIVMDIISNPTNTPLLIAAKKKKCTCIYGYEMFENQAILQQGLWQRFF